jgi:hypothetical protein
MGVPTLSDGWVGVTKSLSRSPSTLYQMSHAWLELANWQRVCVGPGVMVGCAQARSFTVAPPPVEALSPEDPMTHGKKYHGLVSVPRTESLR